MYQKSLKQIPPDRMLIFDKLMQDSNIRVVSERGCPRLGMQLADPCSKDECQQQNELNPF